MCTEVKIEVSVSHLSWLQKHCEDGNQYGSNGMGGNGRMQKVHMCAENSQLTDVNSRNIIICSFVECLLLDTIWTRSACWIDQDITKMASYVIGIKNQRSNIASDQQLGHFIHSFPLNVMSLVFVHWVQFQHSKKKTSIVLQFSRFAFRYVHIFYTPCSVLAI